MDLVYYTYTFINRSRKCNVQKSVCYLLSIFNIHPPLYFIQASHVANQTNKWGKTLLHIATEGGYTAEDCHTSVIDVLLSHGADINFLNARGQSCLHLAAKLCNKTDSEVEMTPSLSQVQYVGHGVYNESFSKNQFVCFLSLSFILFT